MSESTELALQQPTRLAPIQPKSFEDIEKFAVVMAESDLVPKDYKGKPANVCVAILMGRELGVPPMQALQGIAVINGRPSVWGDLMWALVTGHPDFEDAQEIVDDAKASCTLKRRDRSAVTEEFSKDDAQKAGLWGKQGPWSQYPKRMMLWRARTFAARNLFADALKGIQIREEVMDYIDGEVTPPPSAKIVAFAHPEAGTKKEKAETKEPPAEAKPATDETKPAQAETKPAAPAKITKEQGTEFRNAYKAAGIKPDAVGEYIKTIGAERLGDIPADKFAEAMEWVKQQAKPAEAPKPEPANQEPESGDHAFCLKAWDALGTNQEDRQADVDEYTLKTTGSVDWEALATALHARREERGV